ncbi:hypothetical protein AALP_AAs56274U000100 [Arabis alpina]|uniref:Uncharacterized protein n=1 Tax=Arabis alpina TaxID=50452 RepID=A0A087G099_ARAAL|nr:hypothetical protein AALP_AAs56274U000100 [Arabis alpina]
MKKKRATAKGRKAAATGTDADLRRLAEAAAAEKTNSGGQRNNGDPANGGSSGSIPRPKAGVSTPTSGFRRAGLNRSSIGDGTSAVRGGSSHSSTPSARNTLSGSQTSIPTEYPPSTQPPQLLRRQPPFSRLNPRQSQQPQQSQQSQEEQHVSDGLNLEDYELHYHQNQVDLPHQEVYEDSEDSDGEEEEGDEQVEEHVVDPAEQLEYDQMLDNLMALPGRGHLPFLSPHPIPNKDTTW